MKAAELAPARCGEPRASPPHRAAGGRAGGSGHGRDAPPPCGRAAVPRACVWACVSAACVRVQVCVRATSVHTYVHACVRVLRGKPARLPPRLDLQLRGRGPPISPVFPPLPPRPLPLPLVPRSAPGQTGVKSPASDGESYSGCRLFLRAIYLAGAHLPACGCSHSRVTSGWQVLAYGLHSPPPVGSPRSGYCTCSCRIRQRHPAGPRRGPPPSLPAPSPEEGNSCFKGGVPSLHATDRSWSRSWSRAC